MEEHNGTMLRILSEVLHGQPASPVAQEQWPAILKELRYQCVFGLIAGQIRALGLSEQQVEAYRYLVMQNLHNFYGILDAQRRATDCLQEAGIAVVVLKGTAAAVAYPQPDWRCMGDVDLLVHKEAFLDAYHTLSRHGFRPEQEPENYKRHIGFRSEQGVSVELHDAFSVSNDDARNAFLDQMLFRAIDSAVTRDVCGCPTPMLPDLENGLVLLAHINQHLHSGLGLRQIIDWMYYVKAHLDDAYWDETFSDAADAIGLRRLAMVVTAMCQTYLGLSRDIHWCASCVGDPICDELLDYILLHGNFGQKIAPKTTTVSIVRLFRNPIRGLRTAQTFGKRTWALLPAHPWLTPFAWAYQIRRWVQHGLRHGITLSGFVDATQEERRETDFLQRLGVTKI